MPGAQEHRAVGEAALRWTLALVRRDELGPWVPEHAPPDADGPAPDRDCLYVGAAGLALLVAEAAQARPLDADEAELAAALRQRLEVSSLESSEPSLFDGLAGFAGALRALGSPDRTAVARLAAAARADGWRTTLAGGGEVFHDVGLGTAGIVMAALGAGGEHSSAVVEAGCLALMAAAEEAEGGLRWRMTPGHDVDMPNFSHGTAGTAAALALGGAAQGRPEWVAAAVAGAEHLLALADRSDGGFRLPMRIPYKEGYEQFTYSWCHGSTGTSYLFAALQRADAPVGGTDAGVWRSRCIASVLASGVPERRHPGFWDNDGLCCGTAGVGMMLLDAAQSADGTDEARRLLGAAAVMGDALLARAVVDAEGARWRFVEHRAEEPLLRPSPSWMQGSAGIAAFLLRLARVEAQGPDAVVVRRPDAWWAVPERLLA